MQTPREMLERAVDIVEMDNFNKGFEAVLGALDEISNRLHNEGDPAGAEAIRNAIKELTGETDD